MNLRISCLNINGLNGKGKAINWYIRNKGLDVLVLMETWLKPHQQSVLKGALVDVRKLGGTDIGGRKGVEGLMVLTRPGLTPFCRVLKIAESKMWCAFSIGEQVFVVGYIPPKVPLAEFENVFVEISTCDEFNYRSAILMGDLNARSKKFGDHVSSGRGRCLNQIMEALEIHRIVPSFGKYTTFQANGKGITDLFLACEETMHVVNLSGIDEECCVGGSDHRPIRIHLEIPNPADGPDVCDFARWDVRKLQRPGIRKDYQETITSKTKQARDQIVDFMTHYCVKTNKQTFIDNLYELIIVLVEGVSSVTCGIFEAEFGEARNDYWTDKLKLNQEELENVAKTLCARDPKAPQYREAWDSFMSKKRKFKEMHDERAMEMFKGFSESMAKGMNTAKFLKMISSSKKRDAKITSALDPEKVDKHADQFRSTFGSPPTGQMLYDMEAGEYMRKEVEVQELLEPMKKSLYEELVRLLRAYPQGKSAGPDRIFMEQIKYGGDSLWEIIGLLFSTCAKLRKIPSIWRESNVVLVFKNKGDKQDAKNYRPISLTCTLRRIYEKWLLSENIGDIDQALSAQQAGFRRGRSTLEQVYVLGQALQRNAGMYAIFLDFKAAYDTVDRRLLWQKCRDIGMDSHIIGCIQDLFEENKSVIGVGAKRSRPIHCRRGLLQGSAISPVLFSIFIDDLIQKLNEAGGGITFDSYSVNNLFFADDGALMAVDQVHAQKLTSICEEWAVKNGMTFAVPKCGALSFSAGSIYLYGQELPQVQSYKYLGMNMDIGGIQWDSCYGERISKAKQVTQFLASRGMNLFGWRLSSSVLAFKIFIRSTLDYGIALNPPPEVLASLQKVVDEALRRIASARFSISRVALSKCFRIETMECRANELSCKFMGRLANLETQTPARQVFSHCNPDYVHVELSSEEIIERRRALWNKAAMKIPGGNAMAIDPPAQASKHFWIVDNSIPKEDSQMIVEWQTGGIAFHQPCKMCGEEMSREHACSCGGVENVIGHEFDAQAWSDIKHKKPSDTLFINHALNKVMREKKSEKRNRRLGLIASAILKMKINCGGCYKDEKGFWKRGEAQYQYRQNPKITASRAREAVLRNRKTGRPRGVT